jgi:hypothetical protein
MTTKLIGRKQEQTDLQGIFHSGRPEFVALYGRRRVGKTFLVRSLFEKDFAFHVTALLENDTRMQLQNFAEALAEYSGHNNDSGNNGGDGTPADWFEAFRKLRLLLEQSNRKRKVIFIDEMPWLDTAGSRFITALEGFWNGWASAQSDIMLIVCGSAASWIARKLFENRGGLHNRITRRILLKPFTLAECRRYSETAGLPTETINLLETYMIFGGIPYYWSLLSNRESLAQNVARLCFSPGGELREEFISLYASLFKNYEDHVKVVRALATKRSGLTREDIKGAAKLAEGGHLTDILRDLELSGFIRSYTPFARKKKGSLYQLTDHFTLFSLDFIEGSQDLDPQFWLKKRETQAFRTWRGLAFERVCMAHVEQICRAMGVSGVITTVESWRSKESDPGVQIDMLINRNDNVVSLCEMKFSEAEFAITRGVAADIRSKRSAFTTETGTRKAVHIALVTPLGLKRNLYYDLVQSVVSAEDLLND